MLQANSQNSAPPLEQRTASAICAQDLRRQLPTLQAKVIPIDSVAPELRSPVRDAMQRAAGGGPRTAGANEDAEGSSQEVRCLASCSVLHYSHLMQHPS